MPRISDRQRLLHSIEDATEILLLLDIVEDGQHADFLHLHLLLPQQVYHERFLARPPIYNMRFDARVIRIEGVLAYDDRHFRQEARMSKACFWRLVELLQDDEVFHNRSTREQDPVSHQLLVTLFRLGKHGNGSSVSHTASYFQLGDGTVVRYTMRCFSAIYRLRTRFLSWPKAPERQEIAARVAHNHHFGNCVGMIDGSLIRLEQRPGLEGANDFYCRKNHYALNIMAVCDDVKRIRALVTGWAGAVNDQRVFDHSPVSSSRMRQNLRILPADGYPVRHLHSCIGKQPSLSWSVSACGRWL